MKKILLFVVMMNFILRISSQSLVIENNKSPWSDTVSQCRDTTIYIIPHTVEGLYPGCLVHMHKYLHTQLLVTRAGKIVRLSDEDRLIDHAGYTLWDGNIAIWTIAVGIEFEGWYNEPLTLAQYYIGGLLIDSLQRKYHIDDEHVLPHSMVACTEDYCFRARKKGCGQQFADPFVRLELGIRPLPIDWHDPDEREGRIKWPKYRAAQMLKYNLYEKNKEYSEMLLRDSIEEIPSSLYIIIDTINEKPVQFVAKKSKESLSFRRQKGFMSRDKSSFR